MHGRLVLATGSLLLVALGLAGCRDASQRRAQLVVGTFWTGTSSQALQRELVRIAHDLGPVNIEVRTFTRTALLDHLDRTQPGQGREALDLAIVPHDWLGRLVQRDTIGELPTERALVLKQRVVAQAMTAVTEHGRVFGYPLSAQVLALVYDPALFGHAPRSIAEILSTHLPPEVLPLALDLRSPDALAPLVGSQQGTLTDADGDLLWRLPEVAEVLRRLAPAWASPSGWRVCRGSDLESLQLQLFAEGRLASFITGPWLLEALESCGHPFAVMPIPPLADSAAPSRALVGYECVVVTRESRWGDLALQVGARLLDARANERLNRTTRRLPVLLRAYESKQASAPGSFGFLRALEQGQFVPSTDLWNQGFREAEQQLDRFAGRDHPPAVGEIATVLSGGPR